MARVGARRARGQLGDHRSGRFATPSSNLSIREIQKGTANRLETVRIVEKTYVWLLSEGYSPVTVGREARGVR